MILILRSTNDLQQRTRKKSDNVYESPTMFDFSKTPMIQSLYLVGSPYILLLLTNPLRGMGA